MVLVGLLLKPPPAIFAAKGLISDPVYCVRNPQLASNT